MSMTCQMREVCPFQRLSHDSVGNNLKTTGVKTSEIALCSSNNTS